MNAENVVKSFFLGAVIGLALQAFSPAEADVSHRVLTVLVSGAAGLLIGLITEWLTSLLPIRFARTPTYFVINNLIAVAITAAAVIALVALAGEKARTLDVWGPVVAVAVGIVSIANLIDYLMHRRAQRRLRALQESLADTVAGQREDSGP